ncbi:hypothetical protein P280DRAFT_513640 [Massarina eburnea CBS 473.64]|uniref:Uncharacterized protein n=1 Tax=Massarina eburnea CBS 473.64 TaxID=1395130 RepID=A0A6A6SGE6_9PLEO|nr:hypothetical protein P280DRAFT_513640 [Massarina eburnea CBS 473.64]
MGRYETLNPDTQDQVDAMLPAIAKAYKVDDVKDIIPENIRMRAWDCDRRDHIKEKTEDDPRNWGVQFLKDLQSIARLLKGDLATFQADLRGKVAKHEEKHPWCKLADVKELKKKYQNPDMKSEDEKFEEEPVSDEGAESDSYFEELVEPDLPKGKRRHQGHEMYEARAMEFPKKRKHASSSRLRRDSEGWERTDKYGRPKPTRSYSIDGRIKRGRSSTSYITVDHRTPGRDRTSVRRPYPVIISDSDPDTTHIDPYIQPGIPIESQRLQAELECAEAELKVARLRKEYVKAKEMEKNQALFGGHGTHESPHALLNE